MCIDDTKLTFYSSTVDVAQDQVANDAGNQPTTTIDEQAAVTTEGFLTPRQIAQKMAGNYLRELRRAVRRSAKEATNAIEFCDSMPGCSGRAKAAVYPDAEGVKVLRAGELLNQEMEAAICNYIERLKEVGCLVDDDYTEGSVLPESAEKFPSAAGQPTLVADAALPSTTTTSLAAPQKRKAPTPRRGSAKKRKASPQPKGPMQRLIFVNEEEGEVETSSASECVRVRFRKVHHWNPDPCETCRMAGEKCSHFPFDINTYTGK